MEFDSSTDSILSPHRTILVLSDIILKKRKGRMVRPQLMLQDIINGLTLIDRMVKQTFIK